MKKKYYCQFAPGDQPPASKAVVYPAVRLATAIVNQAVKDLYVYDRPSKATDALLWLCEEGYDWLDTLGVQVTPGQLINMAVTARSRRALWWIS